VKPPPLLIRISRDPGQPIVLVYQFEPHPTGVGWLAVASASTPFGPPRHDLRAPLRRTTLADLRGAVRETVRRLERFNRARAAGAKRPWSVLP